MSWSRSAASDGYMRAFRAQLEYIDSLSPAARADLLMFTDNGSQEFYNRFLCQGLTWLPPDVWSQIPTLHTVFRDIPPLENPVVVWRGVKTRAVDLQRMGCQLVSVSTEHRVASNFSAWPSGTLIKLTLPAGLRVLPLATIAWMYAFEHEVLLPPGQWHLVAPADDDEPATAVFTPAAVDLDARLPPEPAAQYAHRFEYADQLRFLYRYPNQSGRDALQAFVGRAIHDRATVPDSIVENILRRLPVLARDHILYTAKFYLPLQAGHYLLASSRWQTVGNAWGPDAPEVVQLHVPAGSRVLPLSMFGTMPDDGWVLLRPGIVNELQPGTAIYMPAVNEARLMPDNASYEYARPYVNETMWNMAHPMHANDVLQFIFDMEAHGEDHAVRYALTVLEEMFEQGAEVPAWAMWAAATTHSAAPELLALLLRHAPANLGRSYGSINDSQNIAIYDTNVRNAARNDGPFST